MTSNDGTPGFEHSMDGKLAPKHPFRLVVKRLCVFLFVMYLLTLSLWVTGNIRSFLDATQSMLLSVLAWDSILLGIFSLIGIVFSVAFPLTRKKGGGLGLAVVGIFGYLLLLAVGVVGAFFGDSILTLAAGLR
ncbi:MAG: hypothetical protein M0001_09465 [Treponema sp.]|nr:hypothetical protein [Treponema sp.]